MLFSVFPCQPGFWLSWFFYSSVQLILKNTVKFKTKFETTDPLLSCLWVYNSIADSSDMQFTVKAFSAQYKV